ncbi:hypothetical protein OPV22_003846 [Ensete ventricosum]|uniref:TF-B3 domain-containing protein n=1 Tax=Ensete ventricosum TaxID=4639 RepID=A0AAV8S223_ENSVE|nr:hypothetical protein OPV22_003846 [Ensete ventricosum]
MELTHGKRESFYDTDQEEEQVEFCRHPPFGPCSPSPSSLSTGVRSHDGRGNDSFLLKEHMFEKVVTPSDVGKLNRLVVPKQHAERHLPMDALANEKGLLLCFEDRTGKSWRFRYSYWNSSQSYVMTKGWSRFVKEKGLDAGDTVSFSRGVGEAGRHRLYIDWKRRPESRARPRVPLPDLSFARPVWQCSGNSWQARTHVAASLGSVSRQPLYLRPPAARTPQKEVQQAGGSGVPSAPLVRGQAAVKRVRLFGVNLDCPDTEGDADCRIRSTAPVGAPRFQPTTAPPLLEPSRAVGETLACSSSL